MGLRLSQRQVPRDEQIQIPITKLDQTKVDKTDYKWIDLGMVAYGIRNDEGEIQLHMRVGIRKDLNSGLPMELLEVSERYHTFILGGEFINKTPHKIETVDYIKPRDLYGMIKTLRGEDKRSKLVETDIDIY